MAYLFLRGMSGLVTCMVFLPSFHIFSAVFISDAHGSLSVSFTLACFNGHKNCEWRSHLVGTELLYQDKALLQTAPLHTLICAYTEVSQPPHGRFNPNNKQTHDHCMWRSTYIKSCNALPMVCKLTSAHHLQS
jgi:hypothetical protein